MNTLTKAVKAVNDLVTDEEIVTDTEEQKSMNSQMPENITDSK